MTGACGIPMLIIAIVLVATGVSVGFLAVAAACTVMMRGIGWNGRRL